MGAYRIRRQANDRHYQDRVRRGVWLWFCTPAFFSWQFEPAPFFLAEKETNGFKRRSFACGEGREEWADRGIKSAADEIVCGKNALYNCPVHAFQLQLKLIGNQRDKFRVGRLALCIGHGIAEEFLQCFKISAIPCNLDGVTDRALYARRCGRKSLSNLRIKHFCNCVDDVHVVDGNEQVRQFRE